MSDGDGEKADSGRKIERKMRLIRPILSTNLRCNMKKNVSEAVDETLDGKDIKDVLEEKESLSIADKYGYGKFLTAEEALDQFRQFLKTKFGYEKSK